MAKRPTRRRQGQCGANPLRRTEPLRNECVAFLDAVEYRKHPPTDANEGIAVLRVLDACQASIRKRRPVDLIENVEMISRLPAGRNLDPKCGRRRAGLRNVG